MYSFGYLDFAVQYTNVVGNIGLSMAVKVVHVVVRNFTVVKGSGRSGLFTKVSSTIVNHIGRIEQVSGVSGNASAESIKVSFPFSVKGNIVVCRQVPPVLWNFVSFTSTARTQTER
jgi:hypothetical protein